MNKNFENTNTLKLSGQILTILDQVQNALGECQRSCHRMDENNSKKSASRSQEGHTDAIKQEKQALKIYHQSDEAPPADEVHSTVRPVQDNWVPFEFHNMKLGQYRKNNSISIELGNPLPHIKSGSNTSDNESGIVSAISSGSAKDVSQYDVKTKSGYSTEEDGTISMKTTASISSTAGLYPYNLHIAKHPASDSDNDSMVVQISDEESIHRIDVVSKSYNTKEENGYESDSKDRADASTSMNRRHSSSQAQSHFNRSILKRTRLSNSVTCLTEIIATKRPPTMTRKIRKTKWQQQQEESSDSSTDKHNGYGCCSNNCDSTSTLNENPIRASLYKVPRISCHSNLTTSEADRPGDHNHHHTHSVLTNQYADSNLHDFAYVHPAQIPIFNNIPVLTTARPPMWQVGPIYIPTNPHVVFAFGHHPHAHLHQFPHQNQQQTPPTPSSSSSSQTASVQSSMATSIAREKVISQSVDLTPTPAPVTGKQLTGSIIRPELTWLRPELICPPTQTGPDGKPIKVKVKRPPLPDWRAAAIENCDSALVELKAARMASREQVYRKLVEEEYEYQRLQQ